MRLFFVASVFIGTLSHVVADMHPSKEQFCMTACFTALENFFFAGLPDALENYYGEACTKPIHVSSIYACSRQYCTPEEVETGIVYYNWTCETYGPVSVLPLSLIDNYTTADIQVLPRVSYAEIGTLLNATYVPDQELFDLGYRTIAEWYGARDIHLLYSKAMFIFWGIVVAAGIFHNVLSKFSLLPSSNALWNGTRTHLTLAPAFGPKHHNSSSTFLSVLNAPPRIEAIVIFIFVAINIVLSAVSYTSFANNLYYAETNLQIWRYVADRTGYLSYANLPIFWLFGIRNNILLWATGWPYPVFSRFHRWVAIVSTAEAVAHSVAYTGFSFLEGGLADYSLSWTEEYWYTGAIATITMSLGVFFAIRLFRIRWYDVFLLLHIALAIVTLVNLFYHTKIFFGEYDGFLWPCVAFWVFDRLVRLVRVMWNFVGAKSTVAEFEDDGDLVRLNLTDILSEHSKRSVGSHYYIYVPSRLPCFWESHPFTLVRWRSSLPFQSGSSSPAQNPAIDDKIVETASSSASNNSTQSSEHFSLMIKPHSGFTLSLTRRLLSATATAHGNKVPIRALLEGPYATGPDLRSFGEMLFIIGGSGISVAVSSIYTLLDSVDSSQEPPKIRLVWAVRTASLLRSVAGRELAAALDTGRIGLEAYVTRQGESEVEGEVKGSAAVLKGSVESAGERPDIARLVKEAAEGGDGRLAIVVCGPRGMMDDARAAVCEAIRAQAGRKGRNVELFAESFEW